jgi:mRNA interferase MazF
MLDIKIHRGDIFWIRQDYSAVGSEQKKNRPAIIVSNDKNNTYSETVEIVYLTTAEKKPMPTHVAIETMGKQSTALCEAIYTIDKGRLENYYCTLTTEEMKLVDQAVLVSLGLTAPPICTVAASQEQNPKRSVFRSTRHLVWKMYSAQCRRNAIHCLRRKRSTRKSVPPHCRVGRRRLSWAHDLS